MSAVRGYYLTGEPYLQGERDPQDQQWFDRALAVYRKNAHGYEAVCNECGVDRDHDQWCSRFENSEPAKPVAEGYKDDNGKLRYDLLAPEALAGLVRVLTDGAEDHGERNWEHGLHYHRVFGAAMRHLWAWWSGEEVDSKSGLSHLDHAAANVHFLSAYVKRGMKEFDDRGGKHDD